MTIEEKLKKYTSLNAKYKYYKLYWALDKKSFAKDTRKKFYESNSDLISETLNFILNNTPYECLKSRHRGTEYFVLGERLGLKEYLERNFGGRVIVEHAIQRNLYINREKYIDDLGEIVGYEVDLPYESSLAKVDLLSYKNGYLYLIELKRCKIGPGKKDSEEQLIRAIMEIETYNSYLDLETLNNIQQVPELKDKEIKGIKKMILASKNIFDDYVFFDEKLKEYIHNNIEFKYIKCDKDILNKKIGTLGKLFEIGEVN